VRFNTTGVVPRFTFSAVSIELSDRWSRKQGEFVRLKSRRSREEYVVFDANKGILRPEIVFFEFEVKYGFGLKIMFSRERLLKLEFKR